eukprot:TRINITY_DN62615_c0_g1_i1.p1 TRINITY_DN62615_c0_g1~~TRINITY_DN62615_c0_g1_i1.p1  ORF type:complete len:346 (-),score=33.47 TRINITY_DN62615_c0_g1_i1:45-1049(-)
MELRMLLLLSLVSTSFAAVFPGTTWAKKSPHSLGLNETELKLFSNSIFPKYGPSSGVVIRDGYEAYSWGNTSEIYSWASATKPLFASMLFYAIHENKIDDVDYRLKHLWPLDEKDHNMTFATVANMISGYTLIEPPGVAFGYNDYGIELFLRSLEKVFHTDLNKMLFSRLSDLQFQDKPHFNKHGWWDCSTRDYARIGWWWMNRGTWKSQEMLPRYFFDKYMKPTVPFSTPLTKGPDKKGDYLHIGSYGGTDDQSPYGPGTYGYTWWFNADKKAWPKVPEDCFQANGLWNRNVVTLCPSLNLVASWSGVKDGDPNTFPKDMDPIIDHLIKAVQK